MRARWLFLTVALWAAACGPSDGPNRPPTVAGSPATTAEDTPVTIAVTAADLDGDPLEYRYATPAHGAVVASGASFIYTPAADYHGTDAVTVTVLDGEAQATATISITVTPVNDAPTAGADTLGALEDRNLLRLGLYELMFVKEVPFPIVINEALEIVKEFSDQEGTQFLNGILDAARKEFRPEENGPRAKKKVPVAEPSEES